ncbi:MAG: histidine kinase [Bacteroidota bacterium]
MTRYHILYVDDENDNLIAFKAVFRRHFEVSTASSATAALDFLTIHDVQLIIADQRMPGMTGADLLEQVAQQYPHIIRMILTGYSDMKAIVKAINKGKIYHYLTKPWDFDQVKLILDNALETYRLRSENEQLQLQKAELEKANVVAQLEMLKEQVNPHFLFNSLNVLRALIQEDSKRATHYATSFSKLYRRILEYREQTVVTVAEELEVAQHYLLLQETRFEEGLIIKIEVADQHLAHQVPAFTLQLLIENAIKHNIISKAQPLRLSIQSVGEELHITNNIQRRNSQADSTGVGLKNLCARYELIGQQEPIFQQKDSQYIVRLPLLKD